MENKLMSIDYPDRIKGCLIGGAAGDALGYPVEFDRLRKIRKEYGKQGITEYTLDFAAGTAVVSDDTQMTLFTAEGIIAAKSRGVIKPADRKLYPYVHSAYLNWFETQGQSPGKMPVKDMPASRLMDIPELWKTRAPGLTCLNALGSPKKRDLYRPINNSKGCGTIMRMAPVGILYPDATLKEIVEMGAEISAITHGHPLGCFPSGIFAAIIKQAAWSDEKMSLAEMTENAVDAARDLYGRSDMWEELETLIDKAVDYAGNDRSDEVNIKGLGEGWVADEALAVALYCALRYENDYSAGIIAAVNHDGDSDSTGAIAGNILGAVCGCELIDEKWKKDLQFADLLGSLSEQCYMAARGE